MPATPSYLVAASACVAACLALLLRRPGSTITRRGAVACAAGGVWALLLAARSAEGAQLSWAELLLEGLRDAAWLMVLLALVSPAKRGLKWSVLGLAGTHVLYGLAGWFGEYTRLYKLPLATFQATAGLLIALAGLMLAVLTLRAAQRSPSLPLRLCVLSVGGLFAFDLVLYGRTLWMSDIDADTWELRGLTVALLLVPFVAGAWRMPATNSRAFVSRHVVFYTTAFVVGGPVSVRHGTSAATTLRQHGGSWGNALQVTFLFGAVGILALLLLSESPLRRLRVFISTHFYRNKYDYRVEWMRFVQTLSSADESGHCTARQCARWRRFSAARAAC